MAELVKQNISIIGREWHTHNNQCIGVIAIQSYKNQWKAYIGVGIGIDEEVDAYQIAILGSKLPKIVACAYFPHLDPEEWAM